MSTFQMCFLRGIVLTAVCLALTERVSAQVIDSTFIETGGDWNQSANWYPAEVPNNAGPKTFNATLRYLAFVSFNQDATISNLTLQGDIVLRATGGTLRVLGTTTNGADIGVDDEDDHGIKLEDGANLFAGALSNFSNGALSGAYRLFGGTANRSTLLQFHGADIRKLSGALVGLQGPFARIVEIGTGGNVLIGGFIAGGDSANVEVVVRAIGPDLQTYGVPGSLPDPTLELRDSNGELKAANDDYYQASPEIDWAFRPSDARD